MKKDDVYQNKLSDSVDTFMNDMTVGSINRRRRDAETLSKIREKHSGAEENNNKKSLFSSIAKLFVRNKNEESLENTSKTELIQKSDMALNCIYDSVDEEDDTVVIDELSDQDEFDDDTVVIENDRPVAVLEFVIDGFRYRSYLMRGINRIGSSSEKNDIIISSRRISRQHAKINCGIRGMFISDSNSTNGTYINGSRQRIPCGVEYKIKFGDRFTLADVNFEILEFTIEGTENEYDSF